MKVLHLYKTYNPDKFGGVEKVIEQLTCSCKLLGIDSKILTLDQSANELNIHALDCRVHYCKTNVEMASTPFSISAFSEFKKLIREVDIIHYHFPYPFTDLLHFLCRVNKPTVLTYHSDIVRQKYLLKLYAPLMNIFLDSVDRIVSTSPNYLESSKVLKPHSNKASVIPIGLDKSTYPDIDNARVDYWKNILGDKFFLFVGVVRYYKGLHILVEAAQNSYYPIVVVGAGPIESNLKSQAKVLGITNIYFLGELPDLDKVALLTLSYAVVFPSHLRSEAFGISLLEGAMYGKPLISSEIGTGTSYINIDGETGLVVPPSNSGALREAMDYLWNNPVVAKTMGESAEKRYWDLFTADKMAKSYVDLYQSLLDK